MATPNQWEKARRIVSIERTNGTGITLLIRTMRKEVEGSLLESLLTALIRKDGPMTWSKDLLVALDELFVRTTDRRLIVELLQRAVRRADRGDERVLMADDVRSATFELIERDRPRLDNMYASYRLLAEAVAPHIYSGLPRPHPHDKANDSLEFAAFQKTVDEVDDMAIEQILLRDLPEADPDAKDTNGRDDVERMDPPADSGDSEDVKDDGETKYVERRPPTAPPEVMVKKTLKRKKVHEEDSENAERHEHEPQKKRAIKRARKLDFKIEKAGKCDML